MTLAVPMSLPSLGEQRYPFRCEKTVRERPANDSTTYARLRSTATRGSPSGAGKEPDPMPQPFTAVSWLRPAEKSSRLTKKRSAARPVRAPTPVGCELIPMSVRRSRTAADIPDETEEDSWALPATVRVPNASVLLQREPRPGSRERLRLAARGATGEALENVVQTDAGREDGRQAAAVIQAARTGAGE